MSDITHTITPEEMDQILGSVEDYVSKIVSEKLGYYARWVIGLIGGSVVVFIFTWGQITLQVQKNTQVIETSVLTVKDKENLDNQIANVLSAITEIKGDIKDLKRTN